MFRVFIRGGNAEGAILNLGARSATGQWLLCYLAGEREITIDLSKVMAREETSATWINPATGDRSPEGVFASSGTQQFSSRPTGRTASW
jgi:hypothetical protein